MTVVFLLSSLNLELDQLLASFSNSLFPVLPDHPTHSAGVIGSCGHATLGAGIQAHSCLASTGNREDVSAALILKPAIHTSLSP